MIDHNAADNFILAFVGQEDYCIDTLNDEQKTVKVFVGIIYCIGFTFVMAYNSQQTANFLSNLSKYPT